MKHLFVGLLVVGCAGLLRAEDIPPKSHPDSSSWAPLFAPDLSDAQYNKGVWTVSDGVLTASKDQVIWTKKSYKNYIIDLEFKNGPGANSGVILHCSNPGRWIPNSVEVQIADDFADKWAKADPSWRCGAIFGHLPASKQMVKKPGELSVRDSEEEEVPQIYDYPEYYEVAFSFRDIPSEVSFMQECMSRFSHIPVNRVFEVACGPAPHAGCFAHSATGRCLLTNCLSASSGRQPVFNRTESRKDGGQCGRITIALKLSEMTNRSIGYERKRWRL